MADSSANGHDSKPSTAGSGLICPLPVSGGEHITLAHGGGGILTAELLEHLFLPAFDNQWLAQRGDAAILDVGDARLAFTTDSYVVRPHFFPGGSIGELAINGTVNDLSMVGAQPIAVSAGFIIEEGFLLAELKRIADCMARAAERAGVSVITGDTKVVERGQADGCYINTSGIGSVPKHCKVGPHRAQAGDAVIVSGTLGDHGMAIMSVREGLEFESEITSDTAPLHQLVQKMLKLCPELRVLRDPTRGGLAASLNEVAAASECGIEIDDSAIPVKSQVRAACEILGFDPLLVANEGKLVCIAPEQAADSLLQGMRADPVGAEAAVIGSVVADHPRLVVARTPFGGRRIVPLPLGEQLPRIC